MTKILQAIVFAIALAFLMLNIGSLPTIHETLQISQWWQFGLRGLGLTVALLFLAIFRTDSKALATTFGFAIATACMVEAVVSLLQLYGVLQSHHNLYKSTGTFYNPGPLGGYFAVGMPVALNLLLNLRIENDISRKSKFLKYYLIFVLAIVIVSLPSTISRTAWIATAVSVIYVLWVNGILQQYIPKIRPLYWILGALIVCVSLVLLWHLKADSAFGRTFMWRMSWRAIINSPWIGHYTFAQGYSNAQEQYLATHTPTPSEYEMAGCPEFAFNEFLQIGVEFGLWAMLALVAILTLAFWKSYKKKIHGFGGALISFSIFAFASYPLHLPAFVAVLTLVFLGIYFPENNQLKFVCFLLPTVLFIVCIATLVRYSPRVEAMKQWTKNGFFYQNKNYHTVADYYSKISPTPDFDPRFLFEYGHSLFKIGKYSESLEILNRALPLSTDPMILNIIGECHQALGHCDKAAESYNRSALRVPSRLYPHYLLYFLYAESLCSSDSLRRKEYLNVKQMRIKIESPATRDLRRKVEIKEKEFSVTFQQ